MQLKDANNSYPNLIEPRFNTQGTVVQTGKQTLIRTKAHIYTEKVVTRKVQLSEQNENNDKPIIRPAMISTKNHLEMV